jgi:hypothetical protein
VSRFELPPARAVTTVLLTGSGALAWVSAAAPPVASLLLAPAAAAVAGSALGRWPSTATLAASTMVAIATLGATSSPGSDASVLAGQGLLLLGYLHAVRAAERPSGRAAENTGRRRVDPIPLLVIVLASIAVAGAASLPGIGGWPAAVAGAAALVGACWTAIGRPSPRIRNPLAME